MGGKGGDGGGGLMTMPTDTSGYATPEQAKATLAKEAPLDLSQYQQTVNTERAAAQATANKPIAPVSADTAPLADTGKKLADAVLAPPDYWKNQGQKPSPVKHRDPGSTTQA